MHKSLKDILTRKVRKTRDPNWEYRRALGKRVVPTKKGTGSYNRSQFKKGTEDEV
jgi:hypothetical protein|tara:strand:- start:1141 stop:1305 length:165 start_codon:yes stop_codon:yes gene_type:complete